ATLLEFSYSSGRGEIGKFTRRSRGGGKSGNPAALAGFPNGGGKSRLWTFPRSGFFHGPFYPLILLQSPYYVLSTPEIPVELRLIFGDALHILRGTLDHLICKMLEGLGGRSVR